MPLFKANPEWQTTSGLPSAVTDALRPELVCVPRKIREHRGPCRWHNGTVDTPITESELPEDGDIHRAEPLPPPEPETFI